MTRTVSINRVVAGHASFLMESIIDPWGEDDQVVDAIIANRFDETISLNIWSNLVLSSSPDSLFLDVGAYTGIYSLVAASLHSNIKCVAFEPSTITFGRLAKNILLNSFDTRIVPVNLAAASKSSDIRFPHKYGIYSLCSGESSTTTEFDHTQPALTVPLDELLQPTTAQPYLNSKSIAFRPFNRVVGIKIDVEGCELDVLAGARELIVQHQPAIIAEYLSDDALTHLKNFAASTNYQLCPISEERNALLMPINPSETVAKAVANPMTMHGSRAITFTLPF